MKRAIKRKINLAQHKRVQIDCTAQASVYKNRDMIVMIDITPCLPTATWVHVCRKVTERNDELQETEETNDYCEGEEITITQVRQDIPVVGHVSYDDPTHKFIADAKYNIGSGRRTNVRIIYPWGTRVEGPATITSIVLFGGAMKEKMPIEFTLKMDEAVTVYKPSENVELAAFPTPVFDVQPSGTESTIKFTFADVTDEDKLKQPITELFADTVKLAASDGTDIVLLPYTLTVESGEYTMTFDAGAYTDFAVEQTGTITNSLKIYEKSTYQYSAV